LNGYSQCVVDCENIEGGLYVNDRSDPADLKCKCKEGYHMDSTTGECKACDEIISGCATCDYDTKECKTCKYSYLMLNDNVPDNKCVHKLNNCEIPLHEQTVDSFDLDDNDFPVCELCNEGYFWKESYEVKVGTEVVDVVAG